MSEAIGPDIAFQQYSYRAIRAAVDSSAAVETRPRKADGLPYVAIGNSEVRPYNPIGHEILLTVDTWSERENGFELKGLQHSVRTALESVMDVHEPDDGPAQWRFLLITEEFARAQLEQMDTVWHGVQRFRLIAERAE